MHANASTSSSSNAIIFTTSSTTTSSSSSTPAESALTPPSQPPNESTALVVGRLCHVSHQPEIQMFGIPRPVNPTLQTVMTQTLPVCNLQRRGCVCSQAVSQPRRQQSCPAQTVKLCVSQGFFAARTNSTKGKTLLILHTIISKISTQ